MYNESVQTAVQHERGPRKPKQKSTDTSCPLLIDTRPPKSQDHPIDLSVTNACQLLPLNYHQADTPLPAFPIVPEAHLLMMNYTNRFNELRRLQVVLDIK